MSVDVATGRHIPKDAGAFTFDDEVSAIFDNMAARSLPMYDHVYSLVTAICRNIEFQPGDQVWDFGVSTGKGLAAVRAGASEPLVDYWGCDVSTSMLERAEKSHPYAQFVHTDFTQPKGFPHTKTRRIRVALWGWTLQFLQPHDLRRRMLKHTFDHMEPGGVLFLMEKWQHAGVSADVAKVIPSTLQNAYLTWRRDNRYTAEEIIAKSEALKGSMWPWSRNDAVDALTYAGFKAENISGLYQMFNFGGLVAVKA